MKVGIFSLRDYRKSKDQPKFLLAAKKYGMDIEFYNPKDIYIRIINSYIKICKKSGDEIDADGIINWIPYAKYDEISNAFNSKGIPYINSIDAVRKCRNKVLTNIALCKNGINQPDTKYYPHINNIDEIKVDFSYPFIYKKRSGSHGIGAQKFNDDFQFHSFLNDKYYTDPLYLQKYINNNGYDYRVLAAGNRTIGGMKKYYKKGEWRTHVAHGGRVEQFDVPKDMQDMCVNILDTMGLSFAGIDIMTDLEGQMYILEVNSVPGMSILYNLSNKNFAEDILLHLKSLLNI